MLEPATTITDYLLTLECGWFAVSLVRRPAGFVRAAFVWLFGAVALASLAGGTVHGFFPDAADPVHTALWLTTLLAIGVTAAAMGAIATEVWTGRAAGTPSGPAGVRSRAAGAPLGPAGRSSKPGRRGLLSVLVGGWLVYAAVVVAVMRDFVVAIAAYLPAALYLMAALARAWRNRRAAGAISGILGVLLALIGAVVQQAGFGIHPVHFDHNAVYHVVQAVALYLLYRAALQVGEPAGTRHHPRQGPFGFLHV